MKLKFAIAGLAFLFALPLVARAASTDAVPAATPESIAAGKLLSFNKAKGNCTACHVIAGGTAMGNVGPALSNMKLLVPNREKLYSIIYDEQAHNPHTVMPAFGKNLILTPKEINEIIDYLYST